MTDNPCAICQRPQADTAVACATCGARIARHLGVIVEYTPDARAVAARQTRRGSATRGNGERPLPIDLQAGARLDWAQNRITTAAREIADERGQQVPAGADPLVTAARWLVQHVEWKRHRDDARQFADEVHAVARVVEGIVDRPAERRWLGQCGAESEGDARCEGDVYARVGAVWAKCRACGASFATDERRAWLDGLTREHPYTARDIEEAHGIRRGTIRVWVHRGLLLPALVPLPDGAHGPQEINRDPAGNVLYQLDAVLKLHDSEATRRAESGGRRTKRHDGPTDPEGRAA